RPGDAPAAAENPGADAQGPGDPPPGGPAHRPDALRASGRPDRQVTPSGAEAAVPADREDPPDPAEPARERRGPAGGHPRDPLRSGEGCRGWLVSWREKYICVRLFV